MYHFLFQSLVSALNLLSVESTDTVSNIRFFKAVFLVYIAKCLNWYCNMIKNENLNWKSRHETYEKGIPTRYYLTWFVVLWSPKIIEENKQGIGTAFVFSVSTGYCILSVVQPTVVPLMSSSSVRTRSRALSSAERGLEFLGMPGGPCTWGDLGFAARDFAVVAAHGRWRSCTELMAHSFLLTGY